MFYRKKVIYVPVRRKKYNRKKKTARNSFKKARRYKRW